MHLFGHIPLKRFVPFWIVSFIGWYGSSLLLYTYWMATSNPFVLFVMQIFAPIFLLIMGWLYFRGAVRNDWTARSVTAVVWVGAAIIAAAALMQPVYGASWASMFTQNFAIGQAMNVVAIIIGGYVAQRNLTRLTGETEGRVPSIRSEEALPPSSGPRPPEQA